MAMPRRKSRAKKSALEARRRIAQEVIRPIARRSLDGFAIPGPITVAKSAITRFCFMNGHNPLCTCSTLTWTPVISYSPKIRCYPAGLEIIARSGRRIIRPWKNLNTTELSRIEGYDWEPSQGKSPLEYLAECAE